MKTTMKKWDALIGLIILFTLVGCEKEADVFEESSSNILNGWEVTSSDLGFRINPRDLHFVTPNLGYLVGYDGDIYKTEDSGKIWQRQNSGTTLHLYSVNFINEDIGFVSGEAGGNCLDEDCGKGSIFLKTTDGGKTWSKKFFKEYVSIKSLHFFNE